MLNWVAAGLLFTCKYDTETAFIFEATDAHAS
jgi:hypothetical protein